jgi:hypothetical protein
MTMISTLDVQKALTVAHLQDPNHISAPGTLDGLWGPNTQNAFDGWVAMQSPDLIGAAGLLMSPVRRATQVDMPAPIQQVLYSFARMYDGTYSPQTPAPAQRAAAVYAGAQAAATSPGRATTPAQRAAASAAISTGPGASALAPFHPTPSMVLMPSAQTTGWLGIDWWIWGLLGVGSVATAGGLYWYYQHGRKHRRR